MGFKIEHAIVLAGITVVVLAALAMPLMVNSNPEEASDELAAWHACKRLVERDLKSPSSATFGDLERTVSPIGNNQWRIQSWVEAQNEFGAVLRKDFTAVVREVPKSGDESTWYLDAFEAD